MDDTNQEEVYLTNPRFGAYLQGLDLARRRVHAAVARESLGEYQWLPTLEVLWYSFLSEHVYFIS